MVWGYHLFVIALLPFYTMSLAYAPQGVVMYHDIIQRSSVDQIPTGLELSNLIIAQIKLRIHTEITSKISAKIFQKVKASLDINAYVLGSVIQIQNAQIEAIQTATVNGLQSQVSQVIEKQIDQIISDKITPSVDALTANQTVIGTNELEKMLVQAETIARTELQVSLPDIQKTVRSRLNTKLKANIKDVQVDIPGVLKIQISAKLNVTSSVRTVVQSVYKSYINASIAVVVQSYIKSIQKALK